jgi:hypothetical protein
MDNVISLEEFKKELVVISGVNIVNTLDILSIGVVNGN